MIVISTKCLCYLWPGADPGSGVSECWSFGTFPHGEPDAHHFWKQRADSETTNPTKSLTDIRRPEHAIWHQLDHDDWTVDCHVYTLAFSSGTQHLWSWGTMCKSKNIIWHHFPVTFIVWPLKYIYYIFTGNCLNFFESILTFVHIVLHPELKTVAGLQNILSLFLSLNVWMSVRRKLSDCWQTFRVIFTCKIFCVHLFWFVIVSCSHFPCLTFENNVSSHLFIRLWIWKFSL